MFVLLIDDAGGPRRIPFKGETISIGRALGNDVLVEDSCASRQHALLSKSGSSWKIEDCGSKVGTLVNRRKISRPIPLSSGDELTIGSTRILIDDETDSEVSVSISGDTAPGRVRHSAPVGRGLRSRILLEGVRALAKQEPAEEVLVALIELALNATGADRGLIALIDESESLTDRVVVVRSGGNEFEVSRHILTKVLAQKEAVILDEVDEGNSSETLTRANVRSVLCAPLICAPDRPEMSCRGIIYLDSIGHRASFDPSHFELVDALAALACITLENRTARRVADTTRKMEAQISAAAEIQKRLLPAELNPSPGFSAAAFQKMCYAVGGDFFDYFTHPLGYGVALADVSGKRLDAAMIMASLHAMWTGVRGSELPVASWLERLNERLAASLPDNRFVTMTLAVADPQRNRMIFANAGHTPALLLSKGNLTELAPTGPVLGVFSESTFGITEREFHPGDRLLLCSDGLIDQQSHAGEEFGSARVRDLFAAHAPGHPAELKRELLAALHEHSHEVAQDDDITLAILGREP